MAITTIQLKQSVAPVFEAVCAGTPTPGMLGYLTSAGVAAVHATAGGKNERLFFLENQIIAGTIDTAYVAGDRARFVRALPGDEIYAWLKHGTGMETTAYTTYLVSDGTGLLIPNDDAETDNELVCIALETIDNDPGTAAVRVKIRVV